jgi:hypothetical protein
MSQAVPEDTDLPPMSDVSFVSVVPMKEMNVSELNRSLLFKSSTSKNLKR